MSIGDLVTRASTRTFGEPLTTPDGVTVIPVTRTSRGGDGAGAVGVFVVHGNKVVWSPAIDAERIALVGVLTGFVAAVLGCVAVIRRPPWPDLRR